MKRHSVWNALSHATVIGSVMFILFFCIDRVNPAMDFLSSNLSKWCLFFYCVASLITALCAAIHLFKRGKAVERKQHTAHRPPQDAMPDWDDEPVKRRPRGPAQSGRRDAADPDARRADFVRARETFHDVRYENER